MKIFKKSTAAFLASTLILSSVSNSVFAGGKDGVEILKDGTKLTWIPTEKIEQKAKEYAKKTEELEKKEISSSESFFIGLVATVAGAVSIVELQKLKGKTDSSLLSYLCLGAQVLAAAGILASYICPKVYNHKVFHELEGNFENEREDCIPSCCLLDYIFGSKHSNTTLLNGGVEHVSNDLNSIIDYYAIIGGDYRENYKNGVVIVERPKGFKTLCDEDYGSNVYSQEEWEVNSNHYYNVLKKGVK